MLTTWLAGSLLQKSNSQFSILIFKIEYHTSYPEDPNNFDLISHLIYCPLMIMRNNQVLYFCV